MIPSTKLQHLLQEALAHHQAGRLERAEALYRQLAVTAPRPAQVLDLWGQLEMQRGRTTEAAGHFAKAFHLEPGVAAYGVRQALALVAGGKHDEAEATLRRLTTRSPRSAEAWNALGYALKSQGRLAEALPCHERAVKLDPKLVEGWYHFGHTLASAGRSFQALPCYERALALNKKFSPARFGRAQALHKSYRVAEAIAEYDAILKAEPANHDARSCRLFALQNVEGITREQLFAEHCAYGRAVDAEVPAPAILEGAAPDDAASHRRLRLAILSPDLRTHSCSYFLEPLLAHLDRSAFELYLYHDHPTEDDVSQRLKQHAVVWRNFAGQTSAVVERVIRADRPDILMDLAGHIGTSIRLPLFARRLAPVQITYLGYPDTTGVGAMDFRFTDAIVDPPGDSDRFHTERLVRFAPTAWAYQPPLDAPAVVLPPRANGDAVTFGCFNNPTKLSDAQFAVWAKILAAVPKSRLVLKGRDFEEAPIRELMFQRLQRQGVPLERVELLPRTNGTAEHLALYGRVDIALDTFPYGGTTTTCEALWMGRPVVTLCGERHASRVGVSLLTAIGRSEWIAKDAEDYVAIAVRLARDGGTLKDVAAQLRREVSESQLMDYAGQAARFSAALQDCWRAQFQPPAPARQKLPTQPGSLSAA